MPYPKHSFIAALWSRIIYPSITIKLTLVMTLLVACACAITLYCIDLEVKHTFHKFFEKQFDNHWKVFLTHQESSRVASNYIIQNALNACSPLLEQNWEDQKSFNYALAQKLHEVMVHYQLNSDLDQQADPFLVLIDFNHHIVEPKLKHGQYISTQLENILTKNLNCFISISEKEKLEGYMVLNTPSSRVLYGIIISPIEHTKYNLFGGHILFGMPLVYIDQLSDTLKELSEVEIFLSPEIKSEEIPQQVFDLFKQSAQRIQLIPNTSSNIKGNQHATEFSTVCLSQGVSSAYCLSSFSLADMQQLRRYIGWAVWTIVPLVPLMGAILSILLSRRMASPIRAMAEATEAIRQGQFHVRVGNTHRLDEIGLLARSFNRMATDLALKDKYRHVLDQVSDKEVARCLLEGSLHLGGRLEEVTVLFADIRGFTALSQKIDAACLVDLLNEHMTAMTEVVYRYHGVVDKFMGDAIMVLFGTPRAYGHDSKLALECATQMIQARKRLNEFAKQPLHIGIGLATGQVIAGCMGSQDRLNYTVIGERVNLVARITASAGPEEVFMDQSTYLQLQHCIEAERFERTLKGFEEKFTSIYKFKMWRDS